ncbi:MAG: aldo/keto reductase [Terracidiphilus sp.]|jgi:predicted aldo/keto reductase-like oxidoreductase
MSSRTSRREFLAAGVSAGLLAPLANATPSIGSFTPQSSKSPSDSAIKLSYKTLGGTGLRVTSVGFGCMITSDPSVIERAVDLGITYFDTARSYQHGNNERMVGAALAAKRKQVVLSTKTHAPDKTGMMQHLDQSLHELNTDYIDIWYLHARSNAADIPDDHIEAQQLAKQQGKVRFIGVSTHSGQPQLIPWMIQKKAFDVVLAAYNFTMDPAMDQAVETAAKAGLGVVAMKVMAGGARSHKPGDPIAGKLAQPGAMLSALKWVVKNPNVATTIPSMIGMDELDENLKAMEHAYNAADAAILSAHLERIRPLYCRMCGACKGACREGLPVADVLRCLTYAEGYGQFALGRERYLELAQAPTIRCADCAACTVNCPHGVDVAGRMARAQELFA